MAANERAVNLQQVLTKTDINLIHISSGSGPCNTPCITSRVMKQTSITTWTTKETFCIRGRYSCKTKNVVYILSCLKCGLQYVGQTGNAFSERFRAHLRNIRQENTIKLVFCHFTSNRHTVDDVVAIIVTQMTDNIYIHLRTEEVGINIFKPRQRAGLNLIQ